MCDRTFSDRPPVQVSICNDWCSGINGIWNALAMLKSMILPRAPELIYTEMTKASLGICTSRVSFGHEDSDRKVSLVQLLLLLVGVEVSCYSWRWCFGYYSNNSKIAPSFSVVTPILPVAPALMAEIHILMWCWWENCTVRHHSNSSHVNGFIQWFFIMPTC